MRLELRDLRAEVLAQAVKLLLDLLRELLLDAPLRELLLGILLELLQGAPVPSAGLGGRRDWPGGRDCGLDAARRNEILFAGVY